MNIRKKKRNFTKLCIKESCSKLFILIFPKLNGEDLYRTTKSLTSLKNFKFFDAVYHDIFLYLDIYATLSHSVRKDNLGVIKKIYENCYGHWYGEKLFKELFSEAMERGKLDIVKWFVSNKPCITDSDKCRMNKSIDILFTHKHLGEQCIKCQTIEYLKYVILSV